MCSYCGRPAEWELRREDADSSFFACGGCLNKALNSIGRGQMFSCRGVQPVKNLII